jgi:hypothetical protein
VLVGFADLSFANRKSKIENRLVGYFFFNHRRHRIHRRFEGLVGVVGDVFLGAPVGMIFLVWVMTIMGKVYSLQSKVFFPFILPCHVSRYRVYMIA